MFLFSYLDKMVKRLGLILVFIVFIIIFFISFLFFNQIKELDGGDSVSGVEGTGQVVGGGELGTNEESGEQKMQGAGEFDNRDVGSAGSGGGGTGGLTGSEAGNAVAADTSVGDQELDNKSDAPLCLLARPGNLPNIGCEVNYIRADSVSLKILNDLDEDMLVNIVLNDCFTTAYGLVSNKGNSDFVFSCSVQDYFESDMTITYTIGQNNIPIIGFVKGFIS